MNFARCDTRRLYPVQIDREEKTMKIFGLPEEAIEEFECLDYLKMIVDPPDNGMIAWIKFTFSDYDPISSILTFPDVLVCILYEHFHPEYL